MGQIARAVDRKLLVEVNGHLDRLLPSKARELGRTIDVFRNAPGTEVFLASASISWVTNRGKRDRLRQSATGRGPDAPNLAVKALLGKLAEPALKDGVPPTARAGAASTSKSKSKSKSSTKLAQRAARPAARVLPIDRGLVTAARRLLGYLVPGGATNVRRSVTVARKSDGSSFFDATATATWKTGGRAGSFTATASENGLDPRNVALARLLAKLERAPIGGQKKRRAKV